MFAAIEQRVRAEAANFGLPIGWEGEVFTVPGSAHLRAKIVTTETRAATIGKNGLTRVTGYVEVRVATPNGRGSLVTPLAESFARRFKRGMTLYAEDATVTFTIPGIQPQVSDGKYVTAIANLNFYAHYRNNNED
jgi:hypothetical protein